MPAPGRVYPEGALREQQANRGHRCKLEIGRRERIVAAFLCTVLIICLITLILCYERILEKPVPPNLWLEFAAMESPEAAAPVQVALTIAISNLGGFWVALNHFQATVIHRRQVIAWANVPELKLEPFGGPLLIRPVATSNNAVAAAVSVPIPGTEPTRPGSTDNNAAAPSVTGTGPVQPGSTAVTGLFSPGFTVDNAVAVTKTGTVNNAVAAAAATVPVTGPFQPGSISNTAAAVSGSVRAGPEPPPAALLLQGLLLGTLSNELWSGMSENLTVPVRVWIRASVLSWLGLRHSRSSLVYSCGEVAVSVVAGASAGSGFDGSAFRPSECLPLKARARSREVASGFATPEEVEV